MKRHPALQDLSRDHHVTLIHCQRLRRAIQSAAAPQRLHTSCDELLAHYETDLRPHMQEEEAILVTDSASDSLRAHQQRMLQDHEWIESTMKALRATMEAQQDVTQIADALQLRLDQHVRWEETHLFQHLQTQRSEPQLQEIWRQSDQFRRQHRKPGSCQLSPAPPIGDARSRNVESD